MLGIYCRTSRKESISGIETIDQQRQAGIEFANNNNIKYITYEDSGKSGYIEKSSEDPFSAREDFKKLLQDIRDNLITEVWVWELSRLSRKNKYFVQVIEFLAEYNIVLWVQEQKIDLKDPVQKAMVSMQGVFAELERQEIVARTSRGQKSAFDNGKCRHGSMYGYNQDKVTKTTTPEKNELKIVKEVFEKYLNGVTLRELGKEYFAPENASETKLLSVTKKVKQILSHEEYTSESLKTSGRLIEKNFISGIIPDLSELKDSSHWISSVYYTEKVITRETWIETREKLEYARRIISSTHKKESKKTRETDRSLCSGIYRCATCGNPFYYKNVGTKHGGEIYQHLRTVDKCSQPKHQYPKYKIDTITDIFFTLYYLIFDDAGTQLREVKQEYQKKINDTKKEIEKLETKIKQKKAFRNKVERSVSAGVFDENPDAFIVTMNELADVGKQVAQFENEQAVLKSTLYRYQQENSSLSLREKYKLSTLERIQKWFSLRRINSYSELRNMLREIFFVPEHQEIDDNILTVSLGDPASIYSFNITHDYKVIYAFISELLPTPLDIEYSEIEQEWIHSKQEKILSFKDTILSYLQNRPEDPEEELHRTNFGFLSDMFECKWVDNGLALYTSPESCLLNPDYFSTEEVSEMLQIPKSTLREWARKNNIRKGKNSQGRPTLIWTQEDIFKYEERPHTHKGNLGYKFTDEQKAHLSEVRKGKKQSPESIKKRSDTMKKKWAEKKENKRE